MRTTDYDPSYQETIVPSQKSNAHCNPIITAPKKLSTTTTTTNPSSSSSSNTSWDWLLYSPDFDSHLYRPASSSSSFIQSMKSSHDESDELDLLASLPTWLLALLSHSNQPMDDENEADQEIHSLHRHHHHHRFERDEPCLTMQHVSSSRPLSTDPLHFQATSKEQARSSTPDTDDGYQSASDASRSDYSHQSPIISQVPPKISYAAAVKPLPIHPSFFPSNRKSSTPSPLLTMNDSTMNAMSQKLKFIAPRFERMHHAKQYSSSASATALTTTKSRSNPHGQRHPISQTTRRR